jgi:tRNA(Ile)-lysidine synthase
LFRKDERILVAVSGGPDSMVLLRLLRQFAATGGWKIAVAHFNHLLRGRESDKDERLAEEEAARIGAPFHAGRGDVRAVAKASGVSLEMAARELRHRFLAETAAAQNYGSVALAHHLDDQVELFFLRLLRGAGGEGLAGMRWMASSPADPKVRLVRPLLAATRAEILDYARAEGVPFRHDLSNRNLDVPRNRVRRKLVPLLESWQPALRQCVHRLMEIAGAEADLATDMAQRWLAGRRRPAFESLPIAAQRRCVERELSAMGVAANFDLVETLRLRPGIPVSVGAELAMVRTPGAGLERRSTRAMEFLPGSVPVSLAGESGRAELDGVILRWRRRAGAPPSLTPSKGVERFDSDRVGSSLVLRHWRPGDRFQPAGLGRPKKLQDLFTDLKTPTEERRHRLVAETMDGRIFWVEGLRISETFKIAPGTKAWLEWRWRRPKTAIAG